MNIKRKAFTLTELMVALSVIGVLTAILMPVIKNLMPDQNVLMAKRANYTIETVLSNLLNDSACYPDEFDDEGQLISPFANGYGYADCECWGGDRDAAERGNINENINAGEKFKRLFADKLQLATNLNAIDFEAEPTEFDTKDGLHWALYAHDDGEVGIAVDVNNGNQTRTGDVEGEVFNDNYTYNENAKEYDVAFFRVSSEGTIEPTGEWTRTSIDINTPITGSKIASNDIDSNSRCAQCVARASSNRNVGLMQSCQYTCFIENERNLGRGGGIGRGVTLP